MSERISINQNVLQNGGTRGGEGATPTCTQNPESVGEREILVWRKSTWGSFGQHDNVYTFVLKDGEWTPIFKLLPTRFENRDSRKNYHRYTYVKMSDLAKLEGAIVKRVSDYATSGRRSIEVEYYKVEGGQLVPLRAEKDLRDSQGFYNVFYVGDLKIVDRKDKVEIVEGE
jgi:hypothetical protein